MIAQPLPHEPPREPMPLLIRGAMVLTLNPQGTVHPAADILVADGRIQAIGPELPVPAGAYRAIDGRGRLAMPGLVNAHVHTPGTWNRGAFPLRPLEVFMLYEVPPFDFGPLAPEMYYLSALYSAIEMLKLGITSVQDDPFFPPAASEEAVDAIFRAYQESGIRATATINQPNRVEYEKYPYLADLLPADLQERMVRAARPSTEETVALYRRTISRWHGAEGGRLRVGVSCSAPQRATEDYMLALEDLSRSFGLPYNLHILETKTQRVTGREQYGMSLVRYAAQIGVLSPRATVIHAVWVDEADLDLLAASGVSVAHNPVSNLRLGSGVMPFRALRDRGVNICVGTDEAVSDDSHNLWVVGKVAAVVHTLSDPDYTRWVMPQEILHCLTAGGARSILQADDLGLLAVGRKADLILLDLRTPTFTPLNGLEAQLVFCETGSSVETVIVDGRVVVDDRRVTTVDEEAVRQALLAMLPRYREHFRHATAWAARLEPFYAEVYWRCAVQDVGFSRWLAGADRLGLVKPARPPQAHR